MLQQAYGEDCFSSMQCHKWYQHFKSGRTSIKYVPISGRPSTSMDNDYVEKVLPVSHQNCHLTVCEDAEEVAEEVGICKSSANLILTEKMEDPSCCRKICAMSADTSLLIHEFLMKHEMTIVPQPPYSPDLAPADFFLFPKWKSSLKGC